MKQLPNLHQELGIPAELLLPTMTQKGTGTRRRRPENPRRTRVAAKGAPVGGQPGGMPHRTQGVRADKGRFTARQQKSDRSAHGRTTQVREATTYSKRGQPKDKNS